MARTYSPGIRCPECGSNRMPRNGAAQGRVVYRGDDCKRYYTQRRRQHPPQRRRPGTGPGVALGGRLPKRRCAHCVRNAAGGVPVGQQGRLPPSLGCGASGRRRQEGVAGRQPAAVIAFAEM